MRFNTENELIKDIYQYDVIVLWMDINNSMNKGFLKYIYVNFPNIKTEEIKSGYGLLYKITDKGYIITNYHVIKEGNKIPQKIH